MALPDPGGTCSADQLVVGKGSWGPGYGAIGTITMFVMLPLTNVGTACVLRLPAVVAVASATGPFRAIHVRRTGTVTAAGNNSPRQSASIRAGHSLSVVLGDWWPADVPLSASPPPCRDPITDVTRVTLPLATGSLQVELPTTFVRVCASPASLSVGIELLPASS